MSVSIVNEECPICFEKIQGINNCTTPCGHVFCFRCITEAMNNNSRCPCCRQELVESRSNSSGDGGDIDIEHSDNEDEDDYDDEDYEDEDDEQDVSKLGNIETVMERFTKRGYTLIDALMILTERFSKTNERLNNEYLTKITDEFEEIVGDVDNEFEENENMAQEDKVNISQV